MGGHVEVRDKELEKALAHEQLGETAQTDNYVFDLCRLSEKEVIKAYRNVLNEPFLTSGIKDMIRYQLNGMLCAFQQLRLLNASLHR